MVSRVFKATLIFVVLGVCARAFAQVPGSNRPDPFADPNLSAAQKQQLKDLDKKIADTDAKWSPIYSKFYDALKGTPGIDSDEAARDLFSTYYNSKKAQKTDVLDPLEKIAKSPNPNLKGWVDCAKRESISANPEIKNCDRLIDSIPKEFRSKYADKDDSLTPYQPEEESVDRIRAFFIQYYQDEAAKKVRALKPETIEQFKKAEPHWKQLDLIMDTKSELSEKKVLVVERPKYEKSECNMSVGETRLDKPIKQKGGKTIQGPLENASVQDQGPLGTCYAHSTSLLYEIELGKPVSALDLALCSKFAKPDSRRAAPLSIIQGKSGLVVENDRTPTDLLDTGGQASTIDAAKSCKVCPREHSWIETGGKVQQDQAKVLNWVTQYFSHKTELDDEQRKKLVSTLNEIKKNPLEPSETFKEFKEGTDQPSCFDEYQKGIMSWLEITDKIRPLNADVANAIEKMELAGGSEQEVLQALIAPECGKDSGNRIDVSNLNSKSLYAPLAEKDPEMRKKWFRQNVLSQIKGGHGVGFSGCAEVLDDPKYRKNSNTSPICSQHAVVIAGYRFHNNKCQVMIWNSWGKAPDEKSWINEDDIIANMQSLTLLQKKDAP